MNIHRYGVEYEKKLKKRRKHARKMFGLASKVMKKILSEGGRVAIEWPADSGWWDIPEVQQFERDQGGVFHPVTNGSLTHLLNISAMVPMSMNLPKAAKPNRLNVTQKSLCQSFLNLGTHRNGSPTFLTSAQCQHLSQRTCQRLSG